MAQKLCLPCPIEIEIEMIVAGSNLEPQLCDFEKLSFEPSDYPRTSLGMDGRLPDIFYKLKSSRNMKIWY